MNLGPRRTIARWVGIGVVLGAVLSSCGVPPGETVPGQLDLRGRDWTAGSVNLGVDWGFEGGFRRVPDAWTGNVAGGPDGRGAGTYELKVLVGDHAPPLGLRWGSVATAARITVNGVVVAQIGTPDADPAGARSAIAPGTARLPVAPELDIQIFVSNHHYRVGGLWTVPALGPVAVVEHEQWAEAAAQMTLAAALGVIGLASLVFFLLRRSEVSFLFLGLFAFLVALRALVTGEYTLTKMLPFLPYEMTIRFEYWTAFLPIPLASAFFLRLYPRLVGPWGEALLLWPCSAFGLLPFFLPLDLLTRSIPWFYPVSIPLLVYGSVVVFRRTLQEPKPALLLIGMAALSVTGLIDTLLAGLWSITGNLVPWGMGTFVALQATTLIRRLLESYQATEHHLAANEFLVKEIHHRVKNSLQVVASLVSLQAHRIEPGPQREVFYALRRRMTAIALVHEKLHAQGSAGLADIGSYLGDLLRLQHPQDALDSGKIEWDIQTKPLAVGVDFCIDAGLILTELVSNAQKYALLTHQGTRVQVLVRLDQRLILEVGDDGPGFPEAFRPEASPGLGFRLVLSLLPRNQGTLSFPPGPGGQVRVELTLPESV